MAFMTYRNCGLFFKIMMQYQNRGYARKRYTGRHVKGGVGILCFVAVATAIFIVAGSLLLADHTLITPLKGHVGW